MTFVLPMVIFPSTTTIALPAPPPTWKITSHLRATCNYTKPLQQIQPADSQICLANKFLSSNDVLLAVVSYPRPLPTLFTPLTSLAHKLPAITSPPAPALPLSSSSDYSPGTHHHPQQTLPLLLLPARHSIRQFLPLVRPMLH
jgi:hypothetical protein